MKRIPLRGKAPPAPVPVPAFAERSPETYRLSQVVPADAVLLMEDVMHGWPKGWTMKLYDVGEEETLRVVYPDCQQVHPLAWHRERLRAAGVDFSHLERKVAVPVPPPVKAKTKAPPSGIVIPAVSHPDVTAVVNQPPVQRIKLRPR